MKYNVVNTESKFLQSMYTVNAKTTASFTEDRELAINFYSESDAIRTAKRFKCQVVPAS